MTGIAFASHEEVSPLELRVSNEEAINERFHISSDLVLRRLVIKNACAITEACSERLIHVEEVGNFIPRVSITLQAHVFINCERTIFIEQCYL